MGYKIHQDCVGCQHMDAASMMCKAALNVMRKHKCSREQALEIYRELACNKLKQAEIRWELYGVR